MRQKKLLAIVGAILAVVTVTLILQSGAPAQICHEQVLYSFKGGVDGKSPSAGLTLDAAGNLYGTTWLGGKYSSGTVFKLTRHSNGTWTEQVLYSFTPWAGWADGFAPSGGLIFDAAGNLYGTTGGGGTYGFGVVFKLTPSTNGTWTEQVLHSFAGPSDGSSPNGRLLFDAAGNLYGAAAEGGIYTGGTQGYDCVFGCGVIFKMTPNSDGSWTNHVIHSFDENDQGWWPAGGLIFDGAGNLYGSTTADGGDTVFRLTPNADGTWTHEVLKWIAFPNGDLIFDAAGNLYGTTAYGGACGSPCGTVFKLTPNADGNWTEQVLYAFLPDLKNGGTPSAGVTFDAAGNLYGTTLVGGHGYGLVFKLRPTATGGWAESLLWSFLDKPGAHPKAGVIFDAGGNLYGTTSGDGTTTFGSVFEILK